jgi:hypothetical protein
MFPSMRSWLNCIAGKESNRLLIRPELLLWAVQIGRDHPYLHVEREKGKYGQGLATKKRLSFSPKLKGSFMWTHGLKYRIASSLEECREGGS